MKAASPLYALCLLLAASLAAPPSSTAVRPNRPAPAPTLCPTITVTCPEVVTRHGAPMSFTAKVSGAGPSPNLTFRWATSAGTITSGAEGAITTSHAERTAVVDSKGLTANSHVTAIIEINGLDRSCSETAACTTMVVIRDYFPADEYGDLSPEDEKVRLDNYAVVLQNNPTSDGHVVCYGGRRGRRGEARARCARAKNYLVTRRKIPAERIVTVDGGYREESTVVLWPLPPGAQPAPSPTVDPREVEFVGALKRRAARRPRVAPRRRL